MTVGIFESDGVRLYQGANAYVLPEEEKIEIEDPEPAGKRSTDTSAADATGTGFRKLIRGRLKSKNAATPGAPGDTSDGKDYGSKGPDGKGDGSKTLFSLRSPLGGKKKKGKKQGGN